LAQAKKDIAIYTAEEEAKQAEVNSQAQVCGTAHFE